MSDSVLTVVPTDPRWQPSPDVGRAAADLVASLALVDGDGGWCEVDWYDEVRLVDCGENLERITCPHCGRELSDTWFGDALDERSGSGAGVTSLDVVVPCCGTATTLDALKWPMAFTRFKIAIWNPSRLLTPAAVAEIEEALGHRLSQVRAHY